MSRAVLESSGDLGVPRVARAAPTQPREFMLSASRTPIKDDDASSDAGSTASAPARFKARPYNRALMEHGSHGVAQVRASPHISSASP